MSISSSYIRGFDQQCQRYGMNPTMVKQAFQLDGLFNKQAQHYGGPKFKEISDKMRAKYNQPPALNVPFARSDFQGKGPLEIEEMVNRSPFSGPDDDRIRSFSLEGGIEDIPKSQIHPKVYFPEGYLRRERARRWGINLGNENQRPPPPIKETPPPAHGGDWMKGMQGQIGGILTYLQKNPMMAMLLASLLFGGGMMGGSMLSRR